MVHLYYHLNSTGIEQNADVCSHGAKLMEQHLNIKPGLKLSGWTAKHQFWAGLDLDSIFRLNDRAGPIHPDLITLSTTHQDFQRTAHMELGGINGANAFSFRKLTDWMDSGDKEKGVDLMNEQMSKWLIDKGYSTTETERVGNSESDETLFSIQELTENGICAGAKSIDIKNGAWGFSVSSK